jgi:hypothetical protein
MLRRDAAIDFLELACVKAWRWLVAPLFWLSTLKTKWLN